VSARDAALAVASRTGWPEQRDLMRSLGGRPVTFAFRRLEVESVSVRTPQIERIECIQHS
jgi:hypothetical protein